MGVMRMMDWMSEKNDVVEIRLAKDSIRENAQILGRDAYINEMVKSFRADLESIVDNGQTKSSNS